MNETKHFCPLRLTLKSVKVMSKIQTWLLLSALAALSIIALLGSSVLAAPVRNVGLTRFEAIPLDNAIRLEWDTETELATAGFMLKRGQNSSFDYLLDPDGSGSLFISSEGGPAFGASYAFTDETVINGEIYSYQLVEVETSGNEIIHGETTVTVGMVPTETPIVLNNGGNGGSESTSATATETGTPPANISPSPTQSIDDSTTFQATPFPTLVPTTGLTTTNLGDQVTVKVDDESDFNAEMPADLVAAQPALDSVQDSGNNNDAGVAVVFAQEDPEYYPGEETVTETPVVPANDGGISGEEFPEAAEVGDSPTAPEVIGATPYLLEPTPISMEPIITNTVTDNPTSSLLGKVYLWVAFISALMIFTAAVLGTILLYTRRRSKD